jgi:hypothetical protein
MAAKKRLPKDSILIPKSFLSRQQLDYWLPKKRDFWMVFDMSNGDVGTKRYCWWFDTKKAAQAHITWQRNSYGANLSAPHKVRIIDE